MGSVIRASILLFSILLVGCLSEGPSQVGVGQDGSFFSPTEPIATPGIPDQGPPDIGDNGKPYEGKIIVRYHGNGSMIQATKNNNDRGTHFFVVDSWVDQELPDNNLGDAVCMTIEDGCSYTAALAEAQILARSRNVIIYIPQELVSSYSQ